MAEPRQYVYTALPPQCIRVLELHPGPSDTVLVCQVVVQQIADKSYEAISYVWGHPTPAATIKCLDNTHGGEIGVGANLAAALVIFRLRDRRRRIWVDALCINQADVIERQAQVCLMGAVFSNAKSVLCWLGGFNQLGDGESTARLAIEFLRCVNSQSKEYLRTAHKHQHFGDDTGNTKATMLAPWLAIKEFFDLKYFHRAWIIQEVGLARHARLFWGGNDVWVDWDEVATFSSLMDANGASLVNHLQLKSWMANHINLVWTTNAAGEPVLQFRRGSPLGTGAPVY
jgi:Heterokaryon incompatibility protein (HET)